MGVEQKSNEAQKLEAASQALHKLFAELTEDKAEPAERFDGQPLANTGKYRNPMQCMRSGFMISIFMIDGGDVVIRAVQGVDYTPSGQIRATLPRLGYPKYKKLLRAITACDFYCEDDILYMVPMKDGKPLAAIALIEPLTEGQKLITCLGATLF